MTAKRSALGRGLGALIPGAGSQESGAFASRDAQSEGEPRSADRRELDDRQDGAGRFLTELAVDAIDPNPEQPRRTFEEAELAEMADSVRRHGVLQPVVVRRAGERYELIMGERRWRASRAAGLAKIPAVVADIEAGDRLELAIVENVQRQDLNPMELAHAYRTLAEAGNTQDEIGAKVAKDRSSIANHLRLLELSRDLQEDIESARISMGHAKALLQVRDVAERKRLRDRILASELSVRAAEELARRLAEPQAAKPARQAGAGTLDPDLKLLLERIEKTLQTRVRMRGTPRRGKLEIEYYSAEDLDRLAEALLGSHAL